MKRDMNLIRKILQSTEELELDSVPSPFYDAQSTDEAYQIALMNDAGLVEATITNTSGIPSSAVITRLTWAGHDFLDASRDDTIWKKAVEHVIKPGAAWTFAALFKWLEQEVSKRIAD